MKKYKVHLKKIQIFGYHGVLDEEKKEGQNFTIDIKYEYKKEENADEIEASLDYAAVFEKVNEIFKAKRYSLLESLAHDIAVSLLKTFPLMEKAKVKVSKKNPPGCEKVSSVSVSAKENRKSI